MQKTITALAVSFLLVTSAAQAQNAGIGCNDKAIRYQAEQLKHDFAAQGLSPFKDAMVSMESHQPYPIEIQLTKGEQYQFIFIGDKNASKLQFELFDGADNRLEKEILREPEKKNFFTYSFVPDKTDVYLVILTQQWKMKKMCGSFTVLKKRQTPAPSK